MAKGIRAEMTVASLPREMPRLGSPIVTQSWQPAGIEAVDAGVIDCGGDRYEPSLRYIHGKPGRVLVPQNREKHPQVLLQHGRWVFHRFGLFIFS